MRDNWVGLVKPHHTILHLGDLGWFKESEDVDWLADLPGIKKFIRGNHERVSPEWLARHGFEEIEPTIIEWEGARILPTHYPQKHLEPGVINVHGHVHNNPHYSTPLHINLSVELWHFAPVHGRIIAEKAKWALEKGRVSNADYGPRVVKYRRKRK